MGALCSGAALLVAGTLLRASLGLSQDEAWVIFGFSLFLLGLRECGVLSFRLPESRRLVPETVFRLGPVWGPLQFGVEMGSGARTYVTSGLPYILACGVLLLASPVAALAAALGFAFGRAAMTVASVASGDTGRWSDRFRAAQAYRLISLVTYPGLFFLLYARGTI